MPKHRFPKLRPHASHAAGRFAFAKSRSILERLAVPMAHDDDARPFLEDRGQFLWFVEAPFEDAAPRDSCVWPTSAGYWQLTKTHDRPPAAPPSDSSFPRMRESSGFAGYSA